MTITAIDLNIWQQENDTWKAALYPVVDGQLKTDSYLPIPLTRAILKRFFEIEPNQEDYWIGTELQGKTNNVFSYILFGGSK